MYLKISLFRYLGWNIYIYMQGFMGEEFRKEGPTRLIDHTQF